MRLLAVETRPSSCYDSNMNAFKILQINVWGGRIKDGLARFIADGGYDVVCMQEATWCEPDTGFMDLFVDTVDKIKRAGGFSYDLRSSNYGVSLLGGEDRRQLGNVILSKIPFLEAREEIIVGDYGVATGPQNFESAVCRHRYTAQKVILENGFAIVNYHGYYLKDPLGDETTVRCMRAVAEMAQDNQHPVIMCGDLNVVAEAPAMRELDFLTDLTALNHVKTTLRNVRFVKDVACDHILVSGDVRYQDFEVIDAPISDHQALAARILTGA